MAIPVIFPILLRVGLFAGSLLGLGLGAKKYTEYSEKEYFNNGICKKCGGHFELIEGTEQIGTDEGYN